MTATKVSPADLATAWVDMFNALESLPDTADGIAGVLRDLEIKGGFTGGDCPLWWFLSGQMMVPEGARLWVYRDRAAIETKDRDDLVLTVDLPEAARDFIRGFEFQKRYPDLVSAS